MEGSLKGGARGVGWGCGAVVGLRQKAVRLASFFRVCVLLVWKRVVGVILFSYLERALWQEDEKAEKHDERQESARKQRAANAQAERRGKQGVRTSTNKTSTTRATSPGGERRGTVVVREPKEAEFASA